MSTFLLPENSVLVASGTRDRVEQWSVLLRKARIHFEVRQFDDEHLPTRRKHVELWVEANQANRARTVIRETESDESLLW